MNKQEIKEWIESGDLVDIIKSEYDESGNFYSENIYKKDDKYYLIYFYDRIPSEKWGEKGFIRGVYEPIEVTRHTRMVEEVYYTRVDKQP